MQTTRPAIPTNANLRKAYTNTLESFADQAILQFHSQLVSLVDRPEQLVAVLSTYPAVMLCVSSQNYSGSLPHVLMSWLTTSHYVSAVTEHYPMAPPGPPAMTSEDIGEAYRLPGSLRHIATPVFIQTYLDVQTWMLKLPHIVDCVNLYKRCWKTERPVFKEEHGIKYLCDDIPVFRDWLHHLRIVMIRTEYETLWKTIKTQMLEAHHGGMVVVGQPGVGK